jgi:hypothetical protein
MKYNALEFGPKVQNYSEIVGGGGGGNVYLYAKKKPVLQAEGKLIVCSNEKFIQSPPYSHPPKNKIYLLYVLQQGRKQFFL